MARRSQLFSCYFMKDPLDQVLTALDGLRDEQKRLEAERASLDERLAKIKAVLNGHSNGHVENARHKRPRNEMSLKDAVLQVTSKRALTKAEILSEVGRIGYTFASPKPLGPLNAMLYSGVGKKYFTKLNGKFRAKQG